MTMIYVSVFFSILAVALALSSRQAMHGLLYLLLGLVALSVNLSALGSAFAAVLLMIIYAGAIMVLFVFVVMLLNRTPAVVTLSGSLFLKQFLGPLVFSAALFSFLIFAQVSAFQAPYEDRATFSVKQISEVLFLDGWFFVEMISLLLTAALIGAFHIGKRREQ